MTDPARARPDRRKHLRIEPKGTVILVSGEHTHNGRISNLGAGGMLMATSVRVPDDLLEMSVEVQIRLDGQHAEWMHAAGRILRIDRHGIAILFEEQPESLVRMIDEMAAVSRIHQRTLSAVLVDAEPERRAAIAEGFRAAGCSVVETSTPLEAIVRLGESSFEPDVVVIADSAPAAVAEDLRCFIERNHPRAKLVTIGDEADEPAGSTYWLSSRDPDADLEERITQILGRARRS